MPRTAVLAACGLLLAGCAERQATAPRPAAGERTGPVSWELPQRVADDVLVKSARFGILATGEDGYEQFLPVDEVPAIGGQVFGWVLEVETSREVLAWQETLRLPAAPADWGDAASDPEVLIAPDGRSVAAQGVDPVADGELHRFYWALSAGDPAGEYELEVAVEGRAVARFRFRVPAPVTEQAILVHHHARPEGVRAASVPNAGVATWR